MNRLNATTIAQALKSLKESDGKMRDVIKRVGAFKLNASGGGFHVVARSILSQQISTSAARSIRRKLESALPGRRISAAGISGLSDEQLQAAGVSAQKRRYLRDLADRTLSGEVNFRRVARATDDEVIEQLTQVTGVGRWTAQMYLMFSLGRPDVFAPDDLGLQNAVQRMLGHSERMTASELDAYAIRWQPWRTVAAWYLWRSLELVDA
ncbi:MAG: hypothetical protein Aurels2KO_25000 [Aureliella sp.]